MCGRILGTLRFKNSVDDETLIAYAKSKGAKGITLAGICCTSNETLVREGIPSAGNFLHQELAILTGAVEAMVVDVQCIMQALPNLADNFHTKIITTSPKVKITGALHMVGRDGLVEMLRRKGYKVVQK